MCINYIIMCFKTTIRELDMPIADSDSCFNYAGPQQKLCFNDLLFPLSEIEAMHDQANLH